MKDLVDRIIAACDTTTMAKLEGAWGTTEDCLPSECVRARKRTKTEVSIFMGAVALFVSLICTILMISIDQEVIPLSLSTRMVLTCLFVTVIIFVTWALCWPHPSRNLCWRTAVDFAEAIGFAEEAMGQPFEEWKDLAEVTTKVRGALALELWYIKGETEGLAAIATSSQFLKWIQLHAFMARLLPDLPKFYSDYLPKYSVVGS